MKFFFRLGILFYVTLTLLLVLLVVLLTLNVFPLSYFQDILTVIYEDSQVRLILGFIALFVLLMNHVFWKTIAGQEQRGRTIAFDNPTGRVTVSLSVVEDLIRRVVTKIAEVREIKSIITASKKGLNVDCRLTLGADVNIPDLTSRLQEVVKRKIQDTVGLEEAVTVRIHVTRIIPSDRKTKDVKVKEAEPPEPPVPFQGYRA